MPLSDYERRVLIEIEFALTTDSNSRRNRRRRARGYVALALLCLLAGGLIALTMLGELSATVAAVLGTMLGVLLGACGSAVWTGRHLDPSLASLGRSARWWSRLR